MVLTDQPHGSILRNPISSGRMVKWAVELAQYILEYQLRKTIKAQALADFIAECTVPIAQRGEGVAQPARE